MTLVRVVFYSELNGEWLQNNLNLNCIYVAVANMMQNLNLNVGKYI